MASLPLVAVANTKLQPKEFTNSTTSPSTGKTNFNASHSDKNVDALSLDFREALSHINEGKAVAPSIYVPLLQECLDRNSASEAQSVHARIIKTRSHEDEFVMSVLLDVYAKCLGMDDARKLFDNMPRKNVATWNSLTSNYIHNSRPKLVIHVFREMLEDGIYPNNVTLAIVLKACSSLLAIELGKQFHGFIIKYRYRTEHDSDVGNPLCTFYAKCGSLDSSIKAFWRIWDKDVISWTTAISACGNNGDYSMGFSLFVEMLYDGVEPDEFALTRILNLCCMMQPFSLGSQIHSLIIKLGYESSLLLTATLMYLYFRCGRINEAKKLFDEMETTSLVTWNAMIAGLAEMMYLAEDSLSAHQIGIEALSTFLKLNRSGMKPDIFTFSSVLEVCSDLLAMEQGEQVHAQTIKTGSLSDVVVGTSLADMYSKCGSIERATKAFTEMSLRTVISWSSMIMAFAQHGQSQQALQTFEDMRLAGVRPTQTTFVGVLSACSHARMVDDALAYFEMMRNEYGMRPMTDHYSCLIDMFMRLGWLDEAFDLIKNMDFEPNEFIWSDVVVGCRSHGNLELAFYAAEQLLNMIPKECETYALLLNIYRLAGSREDVSRVRKMMKVKRIGKLNDSSWISIKENFHFFKPGDRYEEGEKLLGDVLEKGKTLGYKSQGTSEVASEEDKEINLSNIHHSEKLAVAFGLLNLPSSAPIRVMKSVRMCKDSHNFIKFVSILTAREIIIRDSKRMHKFVNGLCSCGDFW